MSQLQTTKSSIQILVLVRNKKKKMRRVMMKRMKMKKKKKNHLIKRKCLIRYKELIKKAKKS